MPVHAACIHTCTHTCIRTCVHAYISTCVHAYMRTRTTCVRAYIQGISSAVANKPKKAEAVDKAGSKRKRGGPGSKHKEAKEQTAAAAVPAAPGGSHAITFVLTCLLTEECELA